MKYAILMTDTPGVWEQLTPGEQAEVVRRDAMGRTRVTDGPFAETKEILGGIYVIEAGSLAEALEWAERSRFVEGSNEVRPFLE